MIRPYLLKPSYTAEEALDRARVPERKIVYLPGPPPSIWQRMRDVYVSLLSAILANGKRAGQ